MISIRFAMASAAFACGCGKEPAVLALDVGRETSTLSDTPTLTQWEVGFTGTAGDRTLVGGGAWPSSGLSLDLEPDQVGAFDVRFTGAENQTLAAGTAPSVVAAQLPGRRLPLFVQRLGAFARPTPDLDGRAAPVAAVVGGRIVVVGGGAPVLAAFDLALVQALASQALPVSADALAATNAAVFATAGARLVRLDLETAATTDVIVPSGVSAGELAGAPLVPLTSGFAWVGPARAGSSSSAVLFVDADETLRTARIPSAASSCAAAALPDGAVMLACSSGALRVAPDGTVAALPFPAVGAVDALAALDDGTLHVLAGGRALRLPVGCDAACTPLDQGLVPCAGRARILGLGSEALLACDDAGGGTQAFRLQAGAPSPVPLREARTGATLVAISGREAALVGGGPASFERYRPL